MFYVNKSIYSDQSIEQKKYIEDTEAPSECPLGGRSPVQVILQWHDIAWHDETNQLMSQYADSMI